MKRWLSILLGLLVTTSFFIGMTGFVSAQTACLNEDDLILRLSDDTNAHAEQWNGGQEYTTEVCFSDIFGHEYGETSPHACTGDNVIIRLSDDTNAHVQTPEQTDYSIPVCYGELNCRSTTGSCNAEEETVILLSDDTNAHAQTAESNSYNTRICCSETEGAQPTGSIQDVAWQNALGGEIGITYVNRTVFLFAETTLASGEVAFFVWDDDNNDGNYDSGPLQDDALTTISAQVSNGIALASLDIDDDLINDADDGLDCNNGLELYFNASVDDSSLVSGMLLTHCEPGPNEPPTAIIGSPEHRQVYFVDTTLEFDASESYDPEGNILEYEWTVSSNGQEEFTRTEETFTHSFVEPGMRTVTLRVTDTQGAWNEDQIAILIVASPYLLTYINQPFHTQIIEQPGQPPTIDYSATDTYIIDSLPDDDGDSCPEVFCVAGNCPLTVAGPPLGCDTLTIEDAPTSEDSADFSDLFFTWTFGEEDEALETIEGYDVVTGWKSYSKHSDDRNDKWIDLTVDYDGETETVSEETERVFTLGQCISGGSEFVETDGAGNALATHGTMPDDNDGSWCSGGDGIAGNGNDCCPVGFTCNLDPSQGPIGCAGSLDNVNECSDYTSEETCTADAYGVGDSANPIYDDLVTSCEEDGGAADLNCVWDTTDNSDGQCAVSLQCDQGSCGGNGCGSGPSCIGHQCLYTYPESSCVNGYSTITYEVIGFDPGTCSNAPTDASICDRPPVTVPCGQINFELSFFDYQHALATTLIILLIYAAQLYVQRRIRT